MHNNDKKTMKTILILLSFFPLLSFGQSNTDRKILKEALLDKSGKQILVDKVLPDAGTAIAVAEPILFKIYGKDHILGEKPYNILLVDGYWMISGSLPKGWLGGTFSIILSAKDGRVIQLVHYK